MNQVRIYLTPFCPFCTQAKQFFSKNKIPFDAIDVSRDPALRNKVSAENGNFPTVPMIFVGDTFIGGYTDLISLHNSGDLKELLQ